MMQKNFYFFGDEMVKSVEKIKFGSGQMMNKSLWLLSSFNECNGNGCKLNFNMLEKIISGKIDLLLEIENMMKNN